MTIVVYYSRTGNTKKIGANIADFISCESISLKDQKDRSGISGFLTGGWDTWREKDTKMEMGKKTELEKDHYIIGTPVWVSFSHLKEGACQ